jgi:GntR family transcriptional repressor for pyruvate dehydrogenase complex
MVDPIQIERRKLFEQVAEHLQGLILSGRLKPGERLPPERELQQAFGVGRPAIREALITLERAGLVEIGNGARARVALPSTKGLLSSMVPSVRHILSTPEGNRQLMAVRLLVEVGVVRQAAKAATDEFLAELRGAWEENRALCHDPEAFIPSDIHFHYVIARFAGDAAILAIHEAMGTWLRGQREVSLRAAPHADRTVRAHRRILEAIEARDPDAAEEAMRSHLAEGWAEYWANSEAAAEAPPETRLETGA